MNSIIMDGTSLANDRMMSQQDSITTLNNKHGIFPKLVVVQVGDNQASNCYISIKQKKVQMAGVLYELMKLPYETTTEELITKIRELNEDASVTAILVQKPLPDHIEDYLVDREIDHEKDVDGFTTYNLGLLQTGVLDRALMPCTPLGIMSLLDHYGIKLEGKKVLIFGRSNLVSNPLAKLMTLQNATVTQVHSRTPKEFVKELMFSSDIIVSAMGTTNHNYADYLNLLGSEFDEYRDVNYSSQSEFPVFIDCGTNRNEEGKVVGDFPMSVTELNTYMCTPPTGCVGPMTVSCLIDNIIKAAKIQNGLTTFSELE